MGALHFAGTYYHCYCYGYGYYYYYYYYYSTGCHPSPARPSDCARLMRSPATLGCTCGPYAALYPPSIGRVGFA